jgi:uncharacterized protein YggE
MDDERSHGASTVRVLGESAIRIEPDEGFVSLTLTALHPSAGEALTDVGTRAAAMASLLDDLEIATQDRSTSGITVDEEFDHTRSGRRSLGHRAAATTVVRVTSRGLIGRIIMRATTDVDARVQGPNWRVSPHHQVWLEAARQAAAQARRKAEAYAHGVDADLGSLIAMAEPEDHRFSRGPKRMVALAASGGSDMHVEVGDEEVTASVWAEFELRPRTRDGI